jgi:uncharacterized protein (DUF2345 family)
VDLVEQEIHEQGAVEAAMAGEALLHESMRLMVGNASTKAALPKPPPSPTTTVRPVSVDLKKKANPMQTSVSGRQHLSP